VTNPRYDVFKMDDGSPIWVGTADALDDAHAKVSELSDCPECVILDRITGERVVIKAGHAAGLIKLTPSVAATKRG
jgi:hypothetical protein